MMFRLPLMKDILLNTLIISLMKYVLLFPFFPLFAILLSEMRLGRLRKFTQVVSYLPHFLSWVVIAGIWISFLAKTGAVNQIRGLFGLTPIDYMTDKGFHPLGAVLLRGLALAGMGFHHLLHHHSWHQPIPV